MNEQEKAIEDIKLIKMVMDRTKEAVDPAAPILILWGILMFIANTASHFLLQNVEYHKYLGINWWGIAGFGFILSSIMGYRIGKRRYSLGINHYATKRLGLIWTILIPIGVVWTIIGPYYKIIPVEGLSVFWALLYSIGIYIMGIFYSKEFIYGGIVIFLGTILSVVFSEYHNLIIGLFMGSGTVVPAVIANNRFRDVTRGQNEG